MDFGTIVEFHRDSYNVVLDGSGEEITARVRVWDALEEKRRTQELSLDGQAVFARQLAVGDRVAVCHAGDSHYFVEQIEPRETYLARRGTKRFAHQFQLVVANADRLAVVVAPNPRIKPAVIDRYILAGLKGGLSPLLVVNKVDTDSSLRKSAELTAYRDLGYPVHFTSALSGEGMDALAAALAGRFTAFCGQSGVGKSTLLASLTGVELTTGVTKRRMGTGRQTTVSARLYPLPGGGQVVDTPGIRVFGLAGLTEADVREYFSDISALAMGCSYHNCTHSHEPECSVKAAVSSGRLSGQRLDSYLKLLHEADKQERSKAYA